MALKVDRICVGDNYVYNFIYHIIWRTYNNENRCVFRFEFFDTDGSVVLEVKRP